MDDIVAVIADVFFQMRVTAAAQAGHRTVRYVSEQRLDEVTAYRLALVDLSSTENAPGAIQRLRSLGQNPIVAFGPHIDTEARKAARRAGADRVLAKSKFVQQLPALMGGSDGVQASG